MSLITTSISVRFSLVKEFLLLALYGFYKFYRYFRSFHGEARLNGSPTRYSCEMAPQADKSMWLFLSENPLFSRDDRFRLLEKPIGATCFSEERMIYPSYACVFALRTSEHEAARLPLSPSAAGPVGSPGDT